MNLTLPFKLCLLSKLPLNSESKSIIPLTVSFLIAMISKIGAALIPRVDIIVEKLSLGRLNLSEPSSLPLYNSAFRLVIFKILLFNDKSELTADKYNGEL